MNTHESVMCGSGSLDLLNLNDCSYMRPSQIRNLIVLAVSLLVLGWTITTLANFIIEYKWWKEIGQARSVSENLTPLC
jgi:hypothetical protein